MDEKDDDVVQLPSTNEGAQTGQPNPDEYFQFEENSTDLEEIETNYDPNFEVDADQLREIQIATASRFKEDYIRYMTNYSYLNEIPLEILFYCALSASIKDIPITLQNKRLPAKIHFNWQQDSSTGKGTAFKEFINVLQEYGRQEGAMPLSIASPDGSESYESFYNCFPFLKGKYDFNNPTRGLFERTDVMILEECSYLLVEKRGGKQTKAESFLKALDDQQMEKSLAGWGERRTVTTPNFILLSSTRLVPEMLQTIATSGLLQRMIPYYRNVSAIESEEMIRKDIVNTMSTAEREQQLIVKRKRIIQKLLEYRQWIKHNSRFEFENYEEAMRVFMANCIHLKRVCYKTLFRTEHVQVAESFLRRLTKKMFTLAMLHTAIRKTNKISTVDIQVAFGLLYKIFIQLLDWIEETIVERIDLKYKRKMLIKFVELLKKKTPVVPMDELIKSLVAYFEYSPRYCAGLIEKYSVGAKQFFKVDGNKVHLL